MSLLGTLALMVTAAFRPKLEAKLDDRIAELERELGQLRWELTQAQALADAYRRQTHLTWRREAEAQIHRQLALTNSQQNPLTPTEMYQALANQMMAQQNVAALTNQAAPFLMIGAGAPQWCNCVPSRSQVWNSGRP